MALLLMMPGARLESQVTAGAAAGRASVDSVTVAGIVRDAEGRPAEGVSVTLRDADRPAILHTRTTSSLGEFTFRLPFGGSYTLEVRRIGFTVRRAPISVAAGTSVIVDVPLEGAATTRIAEAPTLPLVQPFADAENWLLQSDMVYRIGGTRDSVVVPAGFVTDFASIPKRLQSFASLNGPWMVAGVIHDYLYWEQGPGGCTRAEADGIFRLAMLENRASAWQANAMHWALEVAGAPAFRGNATDRANDLPRVIPSRYRKIKPLMQWAEYRASLKTMGVRPGPRQPISRAFCAHGTQKPSDALAPPGTL